MPDQGPSRFTSQSKTTHERLSTNTVGLVALSDFRKRRAELLEQQEREAREVQLSLSATNTPPDRSLTGTPNNASENSEVERQAKKKKRFKAAAHNKLSFGGDDEGGDNDGPPTPANKKIRIPARDEGSGEDSNASEESRQSSKVGANKSVGIVPRALTKSALRREAAERETLRKEFLVLQGAVKAAEIAIPFVFYDGTNIPGGTVRVKKGDFIWVFLDKSRKVGAELGVGGEKNANVRREWARVGVDDLMLVRGSVIIPHHYEFYFFIMNKTVGPANRRLFNYTAEAPPKEAEDVPDKNPLSNPRKDKVKDQPDLSGLEGAADDPTFTKVVDRRWYERNKHIYPASVWQDFDPEKDYLNEVRRDTGGNAFFFTK